MLIDRATTLDKKGRVCWIESYPSILIVGIDGFSVIKPFFLYLIASVSKSIHIQTFGGFKLREPPLRVGAIFRNFFLAERSSSP